MRDRLLRCHGVESHESLLNAIEIRDALRVDISNDLRDAERKFLLLLRFTLGEKVANAPLDLVVALVRSADSILLHAGLSARRFQLSQPSVEGSQRELRIVRLCFR